MHQVGAGVLGPVYRTCESDGDRLVALKAFHLDFTPEQAQTFVSELENVVGSGKSHPALVPALGAGLSDLVPYLALEYVVAESLDVAIQRDTPAPVEMVLPLAMQIANALDTAHAGKLVHGALHPRDIFVAPELAKVTGFGVVPALEHAGLRGPLRRPYTSPEQISGGEWGTAADRFAFAAILYELLTGRRSVGTAKQVIAGLVAVAGVRDETGLTELFAAGLSELPGDRPGSAEQFVDDLAEAVGWSGRVGAWDATGVSGSKFLSDASDGGADKAHHGPRVASTGAANGTKEAGMSIMDRTKAHRDPKPEADWSERTLDRGESDELRESEKYQPSATGSLPATKSVSRAKTSTPLFDWLDDDLALTPPDVTTASEGAAEDAEIGLPVLAGGGGENSYVDEVSGPVTERTGADHVTLESRRVSHGSVSPKSGDRAPSSEFGSRSDDTNDVDDLSFAEASYETDGDNEDAARVALGANDELAGDADDLLGDEPPCEVDGDNEDAARVVLGSNDELAGDTDDLLDDEVSYEPGDDDADALVVLGSGDELTGAYAPITLTDQAGEGETVEFGGSGVFGTAHTDVGDVVDGESWETEPSGVGQESNDDPPFVRSDEQGDTRDGVPYDGTDRVSGVTAASWLARAGRLPTAAFSLIALLVMFAAFAVGFGLFPRGGTEDEGLPFEASVPAGANPLSGRVVPEAGDGQELREEPMVSGSSTAVEPEVPAEQSDPEVEQTRELRASVEPVAPREVARAPSIAPAVGAGIPATVTEPVQEDGRLLVRSTPAGAQVVVNGQARGTTPLALGGLSYDDYEMTLQLDGYEAYEQNLAVSAETRIAAVNVELVRVSAPPTAPVGVGSIFVDTRPQGVQVWLDRRLLGETPMLIPQVAAGPHEVEFKSDGYREWVTVVQVDSTMQARVTASLDPVR